MSPSSSSHFSFSRFLSALSLATASLGLVFTAMLLVGLYFSPLSKPNSSQSPTSSASVTTKDTNTEKLTISTGIDEQESFLDESKELSELDLAVLPEPPGSSGLAAVVRVMSNVAEGPKFLMAVIDPQDVLPGQVQTLTAVVEDKVNGIARVYTITELDGGKVEQVELKLEAGTAKRGRWRNSWTVHSTHKNTYRTTFVAVNTKGQEERMTLGWTDPPNDCNPPDGGDWTIDGGNDKQSLCNQGLAFGPENGRIVVNFDTQLQIQASPNATTTLVWTPGQEIELLRGAEIQLVHYYNSNTGEIAQSAQLAKGYIFVKDQDSDSVVDGILNPNSSTPAKRVFVSSLSDPNVSTVNLGGNTIYVYTDPNTGEKYTRLGDLGQTVNGNTRPKDNDCDTTTADKWREGTAYPDRDGDSYASDASTTVCMGDTVPAGYRSAPGGDCYDVDLTPGEKKAILVHPGQTQFFTEGYGETGSFDYNCDGTTEMEITNQHSITCDVPSPQTECYTSCDKIKSGSPGWQSATPPNCGQSAVYIDTCLNTGLGGQIDSNVYCQADLYSCIDSYATGTSRVQACR